MKVYIVGKALFTGVSKKTNSPYSFKRLYIEHSAHNVVGMKAEEVSLPDHINFESIEVNEYYDLDIDLSGRIVGILPCVAEG